MHIINVTVRDKIAVNPAQDRYVCGNSDYIVRFDFDAEWDAYDTKTARFIREDGTVYDQVFTGNECPVPVIADTYKIMVGAFAGNLSTTTAAYVPCKKSILCGSGSPAAPAEDVYSQMMTVLNETSNTAKGTAEALQEANGEGGLYLVRTREVEGKYGYWPDRTIEEVRAAVAAGKTCLLIHSDGRVYTYYGERTNDADVDTTVPTFIAPALYTYGTGIEWKRAQMQPHGHVVFGGFPVAKTPNPYKLTITQGDETVTYDGTEQKNIDLTNVAGYAADIVIIKTSATDEGVYLADHTHAEIEEALSAGKLCLLLHGGIVFPYETFKTYDGERCAVFYGWADFQENAGAAQMCAYIKPNGVVTVEGEYVKIPNPHALAIRQGETIMTYNGSKGVTVETLPTPVDTASVAYSRWNGSAWEAVTIDQLKSDLGLS